MPMNTPVIPLTNMPTAVLTEICSDLLFAGPGVCAAESIPAAQTPGFRQGAYHPVMG